MDCKSRLENYLRENDVPFREMTHRAAYTAQDVATAQHVAGKQVAKAVMMVADNSMLMVVLPASYRINLNKLGDALGEMTVRFAHEHEFAHLFKDCDVGAMPPFGNLYNMPVYVDRSLSEDEQIVFQAGTHCDTMQVAYTDFARLVRPIVVQVAEPVHEAPTLEIR